MAQNYFPSRNSPNGSRRAGRRSSSKGEKTPTAFTPFIGSRGRGRSFGHLVRFSCSLGEGSCRRRCRRRHVTLLPSWTGPDPTFFRDTADFGNKTLRRPELWLWRRYVKNAEEGINCILAEPIVLDTISSVSVVCTRGRLARTCGRSGRRQGRTCGVTFCVFSEARDIGITQEASLH